MSNRTPFVRTARHFDDGHYQSDGRGKYLQCSNFAKDSRRFIRAALLIESDLLKIFEYIEPDRVNFECFSFRIHELLVRTCIEVEANFKAILSENGYDKSGDWSIQTYRKIESTHFLSSYSVKIPDFTDFGYTFQPFEDWTSSGKPDWHMNYNSVKHDRHRSFEKANFLSLLQATSALFVVIASQFHTEDFSSSTDYIEVGKSEDDFEFVAGSRFRVKFPKSDSLENNYEFMRSDITDTAIFFRKHSY